MSQPSGFRTVMVPRLVAGFGGERICVVSADSGECGSPVARSSWHSRSAARCSRGATTLMLRWGRTGPSGRTTSHR
eukprot:7000050-Prymnesium_polylepis.1